MENFVNGKFLNQTDLGWTFSFDANGKYPIIANRIFETLSDAQTFIDGPTAIPGLILRIVADPSTGNNGAYLLETDGTGLKMNKLMTGDIDIELSVVWAKESTPGAGDWQECPKETPGAVECLRLKHASQKTYIPLDRILVLDDYAKIADVDASLLNLSTALNDRMDEIIDEISEIELTLNDVSDRLDSSVREINERIDGIEEAYATKEFVNASLAVRDERITDLSTSVDTLGDFVVGLNDWVTAIDEHVTQMDSSIVELEDDVQRSFEAIAEINASIAKIDSSIATIEDALENHVVKSVKASTSTEFVEVAPVVSSVGNVEISIDASVMAHAVDSEIEFEAHGFATDAYVEERIMWYNEE